jgi:hypothetical protein
MLKIDYIEFSTSIFSKHFVRYLWEPPDPHVMPKLDMQLFFRKSNLLHLLFCWIPKTHLVI